MTSIQSGMGIGEQASQGRLFSAPTVTQSVQLIPEGPRIKAQERRKEIEGGQLEMADQELKKAWLWESEERKRFLDVLVRANAVAEALYAETTTYHPSLARYHKERDEFVKWLQTKEDS